MPKRATLVSTLRNPIPEPVVVEPPAEVEEEPEEVTSNEALFSYMRQTCGFLPDLDVLFAQCKRAFLVFVIAAFLVSPQGRSIAGSFGPSSSGSAVNVLVVAFVAAVVFVAASRFV